MFRHQDRDYKWTRGSDIEKFIFSVGHFEKWPPFRPEVKTEMAI
jgi:hypothetical protein